MERKVVVVGAAVVAVAALAIKLRSSDAPSSRAPTPEPTIVERGTARVGQGGEKGTGPFWEEGTPAVAETETSRVRDHRSGDRVAYDPDARTGEKRTAQRLPPDLVHTLSTQLEAVMVECTAPLTADARGTKPGVTGVVFVDVADGSLQVTETAIELRDLTGGVAVTAKECIQARWVGQTTPAPDGVSATHYEISIVLAVR